MANKHKKMFLLINKKTYFAYQSGKDMSGFRVGGSGGKQALY